MVVQNWDNVHHHLQVYIVFEYRELTTKELDIFIDRRINQFREECEEAMNFYERVFNGQNKEIMRYNDYVPEGTIENVSNYVLHGTMKIFDTQFTFFDEVSKPLTAENMIHLTINPHTLDEGMKLYNELKENGEVFLPPTETFYSPLHTSVKDMFGIIWNIIVSNF